VADFREWRGLPKRGKRLRALDEMPVRTTWHAANAGRERRGYRFPVSPKTITETLITAALAVTAGITFSAYQSGWHTSLALQRSRTPVSNAPTAVSMTSRQFGFCHTGGGTNCVVDGDTFWMNGQKIRIADIDTPETHPPRCTEEAALGAQATQRLQALLNAGPVTLQSIDRDTDVYGRALRIVMRNGQSLGDTLVAEGLARRWDGARRPWCNA
jgi:micrococcal nuclease